jgi:hypothetical protein
MTPAMLRERIVALQSEFSDAHRRLIAALEVDDLRGLVEASRDQGTLCTRQGALLAEYVAAAAAEKLDLSASDRDRLQELARQLRGENDDSGLAKGAGQRG